MPLKITTEPQENRQLQVVIEVDQARVDQQLQKAARKLARDYRIPGFRQGKAPYHIIVQHFGEQALYNEIIDDLGQAVYKEALEQEKLEPYATAALADIGLNPLTYTLLMPMEPVVDIGNYRTVRVEEDPIAVDEEQVTARLDSYRDQYASWQSVDRPSLFGDMLNIDVRSVIAPDSEGDDEIVVLDETDWDVTPDQENPMEPPGFDEALIGLTPGTEKEFSLSWPAEGQSIYAGKTANFHVKLNSIQAYEKPELTDEFAQLVGPDFETLDALISNIRETLTESAQQEAKNAYLNKALTAVLEQSTLDYPPVVVEDQLDSMVSEFEQRLRQFGIGDAETYYEQIGQSRDSYRESLREQAVKVAERNLIISELLRAEKITVTDADLDAKISEIVGERDDDEESQATASRMAEMFRSGGARPILEAQILQEKTLDRLLAIVRGEEVPDLDAPTAAVDEPPAAATESPAPESDAAAAESADEA